MTAWRRLAALERRLPLVVKLVAVIGLTAVVVAAATESRLRSDLQATFSEQERLRALQVAEVAGLEIGFTPSADLVRFVKRLTEVVPHVERARVVTIVDGVPVVLASSTPGESGTVARSLDVDAVLTSGDPAQRTVRIEGHDEPLLETLAPVVRDDQVVAVASVIVEPVAFEATLGSLVRQVRLVVTVAAAAVTLVVGLAFGGLVSRRARRVARRAAAVAAGDLSITGVRDPAARDELVRAEQEVDATVRSVALAARASQLAAQVSEFVATDDAELSDHLLRSVVDDLAWDGAALVRQDGTHGWRVEAGTAPRDTTLVEPEGSAPPKGTSRVVELDDQVGIVVTVETDPPVVLEAWTTSGLLPTDAELNYLAGAATTLTVARQRQRERRALQLVEHRFQRLVENLPAVVYTLRPGDPITPLYYSPPVEDILGLSPDTLLRDGSDRWMQHVHPDDRAAVDERMRTLVRDGGELNHEYRFVHSDGSVRWLRDRATLVFDPRLETVVQGVVFDVTRLKQAEADAQAHQAMLDAVVRTSPTVLMTIGTDGSIRFISDAIETLAGWSATELIDRQGTDLVEPDDVAETAAGFAAIVRGEAPEVRQTVRHRTASGDQLVIDLRGRPVHDEAGEVTSVVYALSDITEHQQLTQELQAAKAAAEQANLAKSQFLSAMSHELRTPLNAVLGFAQLLELSDLPQEGGDAVEQILGAGQHLLGLIEDALSLSRIEAGTIDVSVEPTSLEPLATEVIGLLQPQASERDLTISHDIGDPAVEADPKRLKQVLVNLIGNAIKYNVPSGSIDVTSERVGPNVRLRVADTGTGIPEEHHGRVFAPFDRAGAEGSSVEGTGLGLTVSRSLVQLMGGDISFESTPGVGTVFWVDLPAASQPTSHEDPGRPASRPGPRLRGDVLYIEDNAANRELVRRFLARHAGLTLRFAPDGTSGLEAASERAPDVVLLDLNLPDMHGSEVLAELRANDRTRDTPVVVVSADASPKQIDALRDAGAARYLTKPIDLRRLLDTLTELLPAEDAPPTRAQRAKQQGRHRGE